jgi:predicted DNA-binding transcriptional regulator
MICHIMKIIGIAGVEVAIVDYLRVFGENVRIRRLELKLTQEQLAELADLHRTYIGAIER